MKLTSLLISMLILLMSGVMCLFSTHDVHAQVPQTKRSEQDSFLKNIRAKKRNNDLQKARQGKKKSNETKSNKIRLRFLNGSNNHSRTSPLMDGSSEISVGTVSLIYGKWGISKSTIHFKGYWHETNGTKIPHEEVNVNTYDLNYIFGSDLTLSLGFLFFAEGNAIIYDSNGSYFKPKDSKPSYEGNLFGPLSSIYFGYKIGFLEIVIGINDSYVGYDGFVCGDDNCVRPDSQKDLKWGTGPNETTMIGIGIAF